MKNNIKAVGYVTVGVAIGVLAFLAVLAMYFSGTFLPVYVKGTYVIGNQVLRYILYALLGGAIILSGVLSSYGMRYLIKKFRKFKRA